MNPRLYDGLNSVSFQVLKSSRRLNKLKNEYWRIILDGTGTKKLNLTGTGIKNILTETGTKLLGPACPQLKPMDITFPSYSQFWRFAIRTSLKICWSNYNWLARSSWIEGYIMQSGLFRSRHFEWRSTISSMLKSIINLYTLVVVKQTRGKGSS